MKKLFAVSAAVAAVAVPMVVGSGVAAADTTPTPAKVTVSSTVADIDHDGDVDLTINVVSQNDSAVGLRYFTAFSPESGVKVDDLAGGATATYVVDTGLKKIDAGTVTVNTWDNATRVPGKVTTDYSALDITPEEKPEPTPTNYCDVFGTHFDFVECFYQLMPFMRDPFVFGS